MLFLTLFLPSVSRNSLLFLCKDAYFCSNSLVGFFPPCPTAGRHRRMAIQVYTQLHVAARSACVQWKQEGFQLYGVHRSLSFTVSRRLVQIKIIIKCDFNKALSLVWVVLRFFWSPSGHYSVILPWSRNVLKRVLSVIWANNIESLRTNASGIWAQRSTSYDNAAQNRGVV